MDKSDTNDRSTKSPKKGYKFRQSTTEKSNKIKKSKDKNLASDSDSDSDYNPEDELELLIEDDENTAESSSEEEDDFNAREFQKFVQRIFPSKSGKERVQQLEKIDKMMEKKKKGQEKPYVKNKVIKKKKILKKKKSHKNDTGEETCDQEFEELLREEEAKLLCEDLIDEDENMDEDEIQDMMKQNMKFNIIFTVGGKGQEVEEEEDTSDEEDEDSNESSNKTEEGGKYVQFKKGQNVNVYCKDWEEAYSGTIKSVVELKSDPKYSLYDIALDNNKDNEPGYEWAVQENIKGKYITPTDQLEVLDDSDILKELEELIKCRKSKGSDAMTDKLENMSKAYERKQQKEQQRNNEKLKTKNVSTLRKLLRAPNIMNDFKYFKDMEVDAQKKIIKRLKDINKLSNVEKPYRLQLLDSDMPACYQAAALKKINILNYMDPGSGEYYKIKQWVDAFMSIPFGKTKKLPLTMDDGIDMCNAFMEDAKKVLDDCVYGLDDAKMQILQLVGNWISNPNSIGTAIAIKGPPGTGKTTLIKEGISKILQRPFAFLALGGATDSSFLEGHGYTYEGSNWGKIVNILIQSKCMNPVIYFDELDKISDTPKGDEITGILTHLTDTTQNSCFHDKYFANMDFDLSKALFIFSYNDENKVNPILKDRMYRIHTAGYDTKEKIVIAKKYLIPKIEKNVNFKEGEINIMDDSLTKIIDTFTDKEKGVRNLKRCLEIIYTKLNLYRLMKPDSSLFKKENTIKVEFPFVVNLEVIDKLIKQGETNTVPFGMYI
uniref:ATPase AAA-type core domain-containing protein n=1 Tax=viral metagenome TaxID=1070528 RepID=A0A6C0C3S3_9ZZZZ